MASKGRKQMLPTGLPSGLPDWPQAFIVQPSDGHTGPILPEFMFCAASHPSSCSRVGVAQKMLCRRLFPRPGEWRGPRNNRGMGTGLKGHLPFTCRDPVGKGIHFSSGLISVACELCGIVTSPLGASGSLTWRTCVVLTPQPAPQGVLKTT